MIPRFVIAALAGVLMPMWAFAQVTTPPAPKGSGQGQVGMTPPAAPPPPGVIRPPSIDPGIQVRVPPSTTTRTPVIRPPGAPGGPQDVVPK